MKNSVSLKKNHEFKLLYSKGKTTVTPYMVIYSRKTKNGYNRIGITVTKKVGKAVQRNRIRRRLKEIYRINEDKFAVGYDIVAVARASSRSADFSRLERAFLEAGSKLGLLTRFGGESV